MSPSTHNGFLSSLFGKLSQLNVFYYRKHRIGEIGGLAKRTSDFAVKAANRVAAFFFRIVQKKLSPSTELSHGKRPTFDIFLGGIIVGVFY